MFFKKSHKIKNKASESPMKIFADIYDVKFGEEFQHEGYSYTIYADGIWRREDNGKWKLLFAAPIIAGGKCYVI